MNKKNNKSDYLDSFIEYQGKQYLPGYYVGGKIHPSFKSKTKTLGYFLLFEGIFSIILAIVIIIASTQFENETKIYTIFSAFLVIILGTFLYYRSKKNIKEKQIR